MAIKKLASELHDIGNKHKNTPLQDQLKRVTDVIKRFPNIPNNYFYDLVGRRRGRKRNKQ